MNNNALFWAIEPESVEQTLLFDSQLSMAKLWVFVVSTRH